MVPLVLCACCSFIVEVPPFVHCRLSPLIRCRWSPLVCSSYSPLFIVRVVHSLCVLFVRCGGPPVCSLWRSPHLFVVGCPLSFIVDGPPLFVCRGSPHSSWVVPLHSLWVVPPRLFIVVPLIRRGWCPIHSMVTWPVAPVIHPASSGSQQWGWVLGFAGGGWWVVGCCCVVIRSSNLPSPGRRSPVWCGDKAVSTHEPPHEQWLAGVGAGAGLSFGWWWFGGCGW
jgi:hypothetical protein